VLLGILQTPHRFRTKRQLWTYSGLGIEIHSSADHEMEKGQLRRKKKPVEIRGDEPKAIRARLEGLPADFEVGAISLSFCTIAKGTLANISTIAQKRSKLTHHFMSNVSLLVNAGSSEEKILPQSRMRRTGSTGAGLPKERTWALLAGSARKLGKKTEDQVCIAFKGVTKFRPVSADYKEVTSHLF
jgi:hypothetical protein